MTKHKEKEEFYRVTIEVPNCKHKALLDIPCKLFGVGVDSIEFIGTGKSVVALVRACMIDSVGDKP